MPIAVSYPHTSRAGQERRTAPRLISPLPMSSTRGSSIRSSTAGRRRPIRGLGHHSDLRVLRRAYRTSGAWRRSPALGYFTLFLVLSAFAPSLMGAALGGLSTGLLLGLLQVPVTCLSVGLYEHAARAAGSTDADRIRKHAELDVKRGAAR